MKLFFISTNTLVRMLEPTYKLASFVLFSAAVKFKIKRDRRELGPANKATR